MNRDNPLRAARIARGLTLETVIAETRLSPHIAEKIDQGRYSELPSGLYARAYVRAVAQALGIDPREALAQVADQLPDAPDPFPVFREVAEKSRGAWPAQVLRCTASALDGAVIGILVSGVGTLVEIFSGVPIAPTGTAGWASLAVLSAIIGVPYFLILGGVAGRTPGQLLVGAPAPETTAPLTLTAIRRRAASAFFAETDLLRQLYEQRFCPQVTNVTVESDGWG